MTPEPLLIGAAIPSIHLAKYRDWLLADQRDLEIQDFALPRVLDTDDLWKTSVQTIKQQLDGYTGRMGVHAPFWNLDMGAYDPKIRAVVQDRYLQTLDIAAEIGATHMVVHSPLAFLGAPGSLTTPRIADQDLFEVIHATLFDVVKRAEEIGCTLVIENIFDKHPLMLTALVKSFESPCVRQSLDTGHAYINFVQGAPPPDYYIKTAGDLLGHIHLQDTDGYSDRHWTIGEGKIDWAEIFASVRALSHTPRLILELRDYDDIPRAMAWFAERGLGR